MSSGSAFAFASTTDSSRGHLVGDGLAPQAPHKPLRTVLAHVLLEHGRGPLQPTGTDPLELTPDHLRAAQACGCAILPATDAQGVGTWICRICRKPSKIKGLRQIAVLEIRRIFKGLAYPCTNAA